MSDETLNQGDRDDELNGGAGDESDELEGGSIIDDLEEDEQEAVNKALEIINKKSKKDFKDIEGVVKTITQLDEVFAKKGQAEKKDAPKPSKPQPKSQQNSALAEEILTIKYPESATILQELKEEAESRGVDPLTLYRTSTYFQNEAKARQEASQAKEKSKQLNNAKPAPQVETEVDFSNMTTEKFLKLTPEQQTKYWEFMKAKGRA